MRRIKFLTAMLLAFTTICAQQQEFMYIEKSDGTKEKLLVSDIQQMYFAIEGNPLFGKEADALDLGLSVKWASWDLGASKKGETGGYYCWADPSGVKTSTEDEEYPSATPPLCISGTEYDIARFQWGKKWRMPTEHEVRELVNSCTWTFTSSNGRKVARGKAPNNSTIEFPLAGKKYGNSNVVDREGESGYFYSGSCFKSDEYYYAIALWCSNDSNKVYYDYGWRRMQRFNVRPVQGDDVNVITQDAYAKLGGGLVLYGTVAAAIGLTSYTRGFFISRQGTPSATNYVKKYEDSKKNTDGYYETGWSDISDLENQTDYNYCAYVYSNGKYYYGSTKSIKTKGVVETLTISGSPVSIENVSGATGSFTIDSNVDWNITGVPEWLSVSPTKGNGKTTVKVTALTINTSTTQTREATLTVSTSQKSIKVTVTQAKKTEPSVIYHEPYTTWGATKWQTKKYMIGYKIYDENDNSLTYYGKDLEALISYSFQNSQLVSSMVVVPASQTTIKAIGQQLKKNNYIVLDDSGDMPIYISTDAKTTVGILKDEESDAFYIRYMDTNSLIGDVLFEEPFITWNTSRSKVKETMRNRGYEIVDESNNASDYYYVAYIGKEKEKFSFYFFNSYLQLEEVRITLDGSKFSVEEVREYLVNQLSYNYVGTSSDKTQYYYLTKDSKSLVIVKKMDSNVISVGYSPYTTNGARKMNTGFTDGDKYDIEINRIKTDMNSHGISRTLQKKIIQSVNEQRNMWPVYSVK